MFVIKAYQMDCYFRQSWVDKRLEFNASMPTLTVAINLLDRYICGYISPYFPLLSKDQCIKNLNKKVLTFQGKNPSFLFRLFCLAVMWCTIIAKHAIL